MSGELVGEPALADPGLTREQHKPARARPSVVEGRQDFVQLAVPAHEHARRPPSGMRVPIESSAAYRRIEVAIVVENGSFEVLQSPSRLETQLVQQKAAGVLVGTQRLGLPPASIEGEHQLGTKTLTERMLRDEPFEFAHHLGMALPLEVGLETLLEAVEPQLLEPCDLVLGEAVECDVREGPTAPQAERRSERACRGIGVSGRTGLTPLGE